MRDLYFRFFDKHDFLLLLKKVMNESKNKIIFARGH